MSDRMTSMDGTPVPMKAHDEPVHWLVKPGTIRVLWVVFIAILVLTVIPDFVVHQHEHFGIDATFGFYAWFGFLSCVAMVLFAKLLGFVLKRKDTFYGD